MDFDDGAGASSKHPQTADRIGARLGAARVVAGLELVDIARDTRVPLRHLRAIEADAHDELPALPYSIGFVRSFARAVGFDPDEAVLRFKAETSKTAHVPAIAELEPLDERRLPSRPLVVGSVALLVVALGGLTAYGAGWFDAAPPPATPPASIAAPASPTITPPAAGVGPAVPLAAPLPGLPTGAAGSVSVTAREEAWIRIYRIIPENGRAETIKTGLLAKGERYDVPADQTGLKLWTGRAGALQVSVGGRAVPSLGGPAETVRSVSLAPADLLARLASSPAAGPTVAKVPAGVQ